MFGFHMHEGHSFAEQREIAWSVKSAQPLLSFAGDQAVRKNCTITFDRLHWMFALPGSPLLDAISQLRSFDTITVLFMTFDAKEEIELAAVYREWVTNLTDALEPTLDPSDVLEPVDGDMSLDLAFYPRGYLA